MTRYLFIFLCCIVTVAPTYARLVDRAALVTGDAAAPATPVFEDNTFNSEHLDLDIAYFSLSDPLDKLREYEQFLEQLDQGIEQDIQNGVIDSIEARRETLEVERGWIDDERARLGREHRQPNASEMDAWTVRPAPKIPGEPSHISNNTPTLEKTATGVLAVGGHGMSPSPYNCFAYRGPPGIMFAGRCLSVDITEIDLHDESSSFKTPLGEISDISALGYMYDLRKLNIAGASVTDLEPLQMIRRLHYLVTPDGRAHGGDEDTEEARAAVFDALRTWGAHAAQK